jgi:hypothetical protein
VHLVYVFFYAASLNRTELVVQKVETILKNIEGVTAVFGGMLAATFIGIFIIPACYVIVEMLRSRQFDIMAPAKQDE